MTHTELIITSSQYCLIVLICLRLSHILVPDSRLLAIVSGGIPIRPNGCKPDDSNGLGFEQAAVLHKDEFERAIEEERTEAVRALQDRKAPSSHVNPRNGGPHQGLLLPAEGGFTMLALWKRTSSLSSFERNSLEEFLVPFRSARSSFKEERFPLDLGMRESMDLIARLILSRFSDAMYNKPPFHRESSPARTRLPR